MSECRIDVAFNMQSDTPAGRDPDSHSPTLRNYHQLLWNRPLPDGTPFTLTATERGYYLVHESGKGRFALSSDAITNQHWGLIDHFYGQRAQEVDENFCRDTRTIGGYTLFPGEQLDRKQTINQHRGTHPRIRDRFDLTLECIRCHYVDQDSPLGDTLARYADFFALFESFAGYVEHFLLQDLVGEDGHVRFFLPFDGFRPHPIPSELDEYGIYLNRQLEFVAARNTRIARYADAHQ